MSGTKNRWISASRHGYLAPVKELSDEAKSLREAGEEIKRRLDALEAQPNSFTPEVQRDIHNVKKKSESLVSQLLSLSDKVEKQREGIESLKQQFEELRKENQKLKSQVERLESEMRTLELGQMITEFERNLAKFVLLPETKVANRGGLKFMLNHFSQKKAKEEEKNRSEEKLDESLRKQLDRWERIKLSSKVTWTKDHLDAFDDIKANRNVIAHPSKIDYKRVEEQIKELYEPHWSNEFSGFLNMHKKLNCLVVLGHIACEFQDAIVSFILSEKKEMSVAEMIKGLKDNKSSEEGKAANTRWSNLVQGKEWTSRHEEALLQLMELDRKGAILHLDVDFEEAKTHIAEYMAENKQELSDIIDMMKIIPEQSGLPWEQPQ